MGHMWGAFRRKVAECASLFRPTYAPSAQHLC
jgi:hypothetical protein